MYSTTAADSQNTCERQRSNRETGSVNDIGKAKQEGRGFYSNVRDPNLNWSKRGLNARTCTISLGQDGDQDSPVAAVIWLNSGPGDPRSEEHTSELQSLMRISYAVFCLKKKKTNTSIQRMNCTATNIQQPHT